MATIGSLPIECIERVFEEMCPKQFVPWERDWERESGQRDVLRCGLVCKRWLETSRKVGMARISVPWNAADPSLSALIRLWAASPDRFRHIRHFSVHIRGEPVFDSICTVVGIFATNLTDLNVAHADRLSPMAVAALGRLRLTTLSLSAERPKALLSALLTGDTRTSLQSLWTLDLGEGVGDHWLDPMHGLTLPNLQYWRTDAPAPRKDFVMHAPRLTKVDMHFSLLHWLNSHSPLASQIRTIRISPRSGSPEIVNVDLSAFRSARRIEVSANPLTRFSLTHLPLALGTLAHDITIAVGLWLEDEGEWRNGRALDKLCSRGDGDENGTDGPSSWLLDICGRRGTTLEWKTWRDSGTKSVTTLYPPRQ